jgi:hypothetical protein
MPHGCVPAVRPRACIPPAPTPAPPEPTPFPPYSAPQPTPSSLPLILAQAYNTAPRPLTPAQPSPNLLAYRPWPRPAPSLSSPVTQPAQADLCQRQGQPTPLPSPSSQFVPSPPPQGGQLLCVVAVVLMWGGDAAKCWCSEVAQ